MSDSMILGTNLVSFASGVSSEDRSDIMDVLLLAELSASKRHDQEKMWEPWINAYTQVLADSGFVSRGSIAHEPVKVSSKGQFQRETSKLVQKITPPQLAGVARSALDTMFNSDHAQSFFSTWLGFNSGRSDSFQIVPCASAASGVVNIAACGLQMVTRTRLNIPIIGIIQRPFSYEMNLTLRGAGFVYHRDTYARQRERVQKALQAFGTSELQRISI